MVNWQFPAEKMSMLSVHVSIDFITCSIAKLFGH